MKYLINLIRTSLKAQIVTGVVAVALVAGVSYGGYTIYSNHSGNLQTPLLTEEQRAEIDANSVEANDKIKEEQAQFKQLQVVKESITALDEKFVFDYKTDKVEDEIAHYKEILTEKKKIKDAEIAKQTDEEAKKKQEELDKKTEGTVASGSDSSKPSTQSTTPSGNGNSAPSNTAPSGSSNTTTSKPATPAPTPAPEPTPAPAPAPTPAPAPAEPAIASGWKDDIANQLVSSMSLSDTNTPDNQNYTWESHQYLWGLLDGWTNGSGATQGSLNQAMKDQYPDTSFPLKINLMFTFTANTLDHDTLLSKLYDNSMAYNVRGITFIKVYYDADTKTTTVYFAGGNTSS